MTTNPVLYPGADSAAPGEPLPEGTKILAAYVGAPDLPGQPDARHVWTLPEWDLYFNPGSHLYGGPELRALPVYLHDYPGDPVADAANAADAMADLGWAMDRGRLIAWDAEMLVDPGYAQALADELDKRGARLMKYGPGSTVFRNPAAPGGTWLADISYRNAP